MMMSARSKSKNREGSLLFPSLLLLLLRMGLPVQTLQTLHSLWQIASSSSSAAGTTIAQWSITQWQCTTVWAFFEHRKCDCRWHLTRNVPLSLSHLGHYSSFCAVVFLLLLFIEVNLIARWRRHTVAATVWQVRPLLNWCEVRNMRALFLKHAQCNFSHLQDCVFFFFFTSDSLFSLALFNCLWVACLSV